MLSRTLLLIVVLEYGSIQNILWQYMMIHIGVSCIWAPLYGRKVLFIFSLHGVISFVVYSGYAL